MLVAMKAYPKSFFGGILFTFVILCSNIFVQKVQVVGKVTPVLVFATVTDILLVLPAVLFLFVLRRKPTLSLLAPLWLLGAGIVHWLVPPYAKEHLMFMNISLVVVEGSFLLLEAVLIVIFIKYIKTWQRHFTSTLHTHPHLLSRIYEANHHTFKDYPEIEKVIGILSTDLSAIRYALLPSLDRVKKGKHTFSYHKKSEYSGVFFMLVHAMLIEIIAVHVMLMQYSHMAAWIATILDIYALVFLIADYQAIRKSPVVIHNHQLHLQKGLRFHITVPLKMVKEIRPFEGGGLPEDGRYFNLTLGGLEKHLPQFEIKLNEEVKGRGLLGRKRTVSRIFVTVDEPERFLQELHDVGI